MNPSETNYEKKEPSFKESRIRKITQLYYSNPEIIKTIFQFCKNREVTPRYFEGFGKRPDTFQYPSDILELVKKGATSFHCSEEIWRDPLEITNALKEVEINDLRTGWDFLIDIDCKWLDYSKKAAQAIVQVLEENKIKNFGIKFSGSKGFHIIIPWKSFPKEIAGVETKNLFPEVPRKIISFLRYSAEQKFKENLPENFEEEFKDTKIRRGIKCRQCNEISSEKEKTHYICESCRREEIKFSQNQNTEKKLFKCPECGKPFFIISSKKIYFCKNCDLSSENSPNSFSQTFEVDLFDLLGLDIILVSPRHLFRAPYSLHEKTTLASIVIKKEELENFQPSQADPLKVKIKNFYPDSEENEAKDFVMQALDWFDQNSPEEKSFSEASQKKYDSEFKEIKIDRTNLKYPPSIEQILKGVSDGRKRALFILLNYFRCINFEFDEIEKIVKEWNEKNEQPLKEGYIRSQIIWHKRQPNKVLPPNYDKDYYKAIGIIPTEDELRSKNPVSYTVRKSYKPEDKKKKPEKKKKNKKNSATTK